MEKYKNYEEWQEEYRFCLLALAYITGALIGFLAGISL